MVSSQLEVYLLSRPVYVCMYSRTWIVSTLKGRQNRYSLTEVLTIQGAFNGMVLLHDEVGTEQ